MILVLSRKDAGFIEYLLAEEKYRIADYLNQMDNGDIPYDSADYEIKYAQYKDLERVEGEVFSQIIEEDLRNRRSIE